MKIIVFFSLAVACGKGCSAPGISQGSDPREFILCSDQNGTMVKSNLLCDDDFVFVNEKKICSQKNNLNIKESNQKKCIEVGESCQDCNTAQFCIKVDNEIVQMSNTNCADDEVCVDQACRKKSLGYNCYQQNFVCASEGVFPDPTDCTKYHYCIPNGDGYVDIERKCSKGFYNLDDQCGKDTCPLDLPLCNNQFEARSVIGSTFYICILDGSNLNPHFFKCPNGGVFTESTLTCA